MHFALPATKTFAYLCGSAVAGIAVMLGASNAIEAVVGREPRPWVETGILATFFTLILVMAYSGWALMVRSVINFNVAFWERLAAALRSRKTADTVARIAPSARKIGDIIILVGWAVWTLGLTIAVPAMIRDLSS